MRGTRGLMFGKVSWLAGLGRWCTVEGEKVMAAGFGEEKEGMDGELRTCLVTLLDGVELVRLPGWRVYRVEKWSWVSPWIRSTAFGVPRRG